VGVKGGQNVWNFKAGEVLIKFRRYATLMTFETEFLTPQLRDGSHMSNPQNKTKIAKGQLLPRELHTIANPSCNILV
jgi:hypothetical protein